MTDEELQDLHRRLAMRDQSGADAMDLNALNGRDLAELAVFESVRRKRLFERMSPVVFVAGIVVFLLSLARLLFGYHGPDGLLLLVSFIYSFGLIMQLGGAPRSTARERMAACFRMSDRVDVVPAALELFQMGHIRKNFSSDSSPAEESLRICLKRLLPKVEAWTTEAWTREQRNGLLVALAEPTFDTELTLCCLRVLAFAGSAESVAVVQRLSRLGGSGNAGRVRALAQQVLPEIQAWIADRSIPERLLRPAQPGQSELLLRSWSNPPSADEALLLRPEATQTQSLS